MTPLPLLALLLGQVPVGPGLPVGTPVHVVVCDATSRRPLYSIYAAAGSTLYGVPGVQLGSTPRSAPPPTNGARTGRHTKPKPKGDLDRARDRENVDFRFQ